MPNIVPRPVIHVPAPVAHAPYPQHSEPSSPVTPGGVGAIEDLLDDTLTRISRASGAFPPRPVRSPLPPPQPAPSLDDMLADLMLQIEELDQLRQPVDHVRL